MFRQLEATLASAAAVLGGPLAAAVASPLVALVAHDRGRAEIDPAEFHAACGARAPIDLINFQPELAPVVFVFIEVGTEDPD